MFSMVHIFLSVNIVRLESKHNTRSLHSENVKLFFLANTLGRNELLFESKILELKLAVESLNRNNSRVLFEKQSSSEVHHGVFIVPAIEKLFDNPDI